MWDPLLRPLLWLLLHTNPIISLLRSRGAIDKPSFFAFANYAPDRHSHNIGRPLVSGGRDTTQMDAVQSTSI